MNINRKTLIPFWKNLILVLSWIIFSPLFLFLSIKWKRPKLFSRIILTALAPLTLLAILLIFWQGYGYYYYHEKRGSRSEIETKTGLEIPEYNVIGKKHITDGPSFNGDFTMEYTVTLDSIDSMGFFRILEKQIQPGTIKNEEINRKNWSSDSDGRYMFYHNDFQEFLVLKIDEKTREMRIIYGSS